MSSRMDAFATWSLRLAIVCLPLMGFAVSSIQIELLAPLQGFMVFVAAALVGGLVSLVLAGGGLICTRADTGRTGWVKALAAAALAGVMLAIPIGARASAGPLRS